MQLVIPVGEVQDLDSAIAVIGEVMVELTQAERSGSGAALYSMGFAGDTFNTAVSLSRLGMPPTYVTILGDDPQSDQILSMMTEERIDTGLVARAAGRQPGLYMISNRPDGERSFRYWRGESPARELFNDEDSLSRVEEQLLTFPYLYFSGISLAILREGGRRRFLAFLARYRAHGGRVIFDSNYRASLWQSLQEAQASLEEAMRLCDIALLTLEDEQALWGIDSAEQVIERHRRQGVAEVVVKQGAEPVELWAEEQRGRVSVPPVTDVVDTTGAGDAFNAGYLAARLGGGSPREAADCGNCAAAAVIRQRGGIVCADYFAQEVGLFMA